MDAYAPEGCKPWMVYISKRMAFCNGMHMGSTFAQHESEQTSIWCFVAKEIEPNDLMKKSK